MEFIECFERNKALYILIKEKHKRVHCHSNQWHRNTFIDIII